MSTLQARFDVRASFSAPVIVAIPVNNEAERIGDCLQALAAQRDVPPAEVLLLLNNCTDATSEVVAALSPRLPIAVHAVTVTLPSDQANAGHARRIAMQRIAECGGTHGILLTTDADSRAAPDWIAANLAALRAGADAVAGRAEIDPVEAARIPAHLHADDALECAYAYQLDEIAALLDPHPADPWPRHSEESGASIAVTCAAYHRAGGVPAMPCAEDRGFIAALRRVDAAIRHAPDVRVVVSGRTEGRARGGMADTIRRRIVCQDEWIDDRLEPAFDLNRRATLRARFRAARRSGRLPGELPHQLGLPASRLAELLAFSFFGTGWESIEQESPILRKVGVRRADLAREMAHANALLRRARTRHAMLGDGGPTIHSNRRSIFVVQKRHFGVTSAGVLQRGSG